MGILHRNLVLEDVNPALKRLIRSMRRVALEVNVADLQGDPSPTTCKRIAVLPMQLHNQDGFRHVKISDLFDKIFCNGQQLTLAATGEDPLKFYSWEYCSIVNLEDVLGISRNFHTVRVHLRITEERRVKTDLRQLYSVFLSEYFMTLSIRLHLDVATALGPGVHIKEEEGEGNLYSDCMEYRPRLYLEAKQSEDAKGVGPEEGH